MRYPFRASRILVRTKGNARNQMITVLTLATAPRASPEPTVKTRILEEQPPYQYHSTTAKTEDAQLSTRTTPTHVHAKSTSLVTIATSRCRVLTTVSVATVVVSTPKTTCPILALANEVTPELIATFQFHATEILVRDTVIVRIYQISLLTFVFVTPAGLDGIAAVV